MNQQVLAEKEKTKETQQEEKTYTAENVPGGVIKALQAHTAPEKGRYALNHVHVQGRDLAAADGASLAIVTLPEELGEEALYLMPKPRFGKNKPVTLTRQNGQIRAEQRDGTSAKLEVYRAASKRMRFPNYREVIPSEKQGQKLLVSIKRLQSALELLSGAGYDTADFTIQGHDRPFRIDGVEFGCGGNRRERDIKATVVISPVLPDQK